MKKSIIVFFSFFSLYSCFAQTDCKLWKPSSFCDIPDSLSLPTYFYGISVSWVAKNCDFIDNKNLVGIWITIRNSKDSSFSIKTKFKNIKLVKKNSGKIFNPFALLWFDWDPQKNIYEKNYLTSSFKARKYVAEFDPSGKLDLIMIFKEAEKGDTIIIDDFIKVVISE